MLKIIKIHLILITLTLPSFAQSETKPMDITGTYYCIGNDHTSDIEYTLQITVTEEGKIYREDVFEQGLENTTNSFKGVGIFAKDSKDTFVTAFWQKNNKDKIGVNISQIQPDGSWIGIWKWRDKPQINTEVCRKVVPYQHF